MSLHITEYNILQEYQKSRAEIIRQFDEHETRRNELQKQLCKFLTLQSSSRLIHSTFFYLASSNTTNPKIRAINDVTKYDSLEVQALDIFM